MGKTYNEACGIIQEYFVDNFAGSAKCLIGNSYETEQFPVKDYPCVHFYILPSDRKRITLSSPRACYRYFVKVCCEIYVYKDKGDYDFYDLIDQIVLIFGSKKIQGITFHEPVILNTPFHKDWLSTVISIKGQWDSVIDNRVTEPKIIIDSFVPILQFFNDRNTQYIPFL